jgi:type IV pilus assembly protein PilQ
MKGRWFIVFIQVLFIGGYGLYAGAQAPPAENRPADAKVIQETNLRYVDNITVTRLPGRERVTISYSNRSVLTLPREPLVAVEDGPQSILIKVEDAFVPESLRKPLVERGMEHIVRVVPYQVGREGKQWVHVIVDLVNRVPYALRREGESILVDFHVPPTRGKRPETKADPPMISPPVTPGGPREGAPAPSLPPMVNLDFQEAGIKSVLRLLADLGGVNIVAGEDVRGAVTVSLKNVTWEKALAVILETMGLAQRQVGNVISVIPLERMRKEEAQRAALVEAERRAEQERRRAEIEKEKEALALEKERQRLAEERERQKLAREQELRRQAQEEERQRLAREQEERRLAREEARQKQVREQEERRLAQEEERQKLAREQEQRRLAREEERQKLAWEQEERRQAEEGERRRLALERERLELEAKIKAERERQELVAREQAKRERPPERPPEAGADVFVDMDIRRALQLLTEEGRRRGEAVSIVVAEDVKGTVTADFRDVPWDQKLAVLLDIKGLAKRRVGNVISVIPLERMRNEEAERAAQREAERRAELERRRMEQEQREREQRILAEQIKIDDLRRREEQKVVPPALLTRVVSVKFANPKELQENLQELLGPPDKEGRTRGTVRIDEHSNSLILQAPREELTRMLALIEKVDRPTPQILIKANIVETTKDTARNLGVMWGGVFGTRVGGSSFFVTPGGAGTIPGATTPPGQAFSGGYTPTSVGRGISGQGFGVNFPAQGLTAAASGSLGLMFGTIGGNILEVQLSAMQKDGVLNILSSPQITTLDNQMAFTENGERIPYVSLDRDGRPEVKFQDAVLRLEITPNTIDDQTMKMKIVVKKDEVDTSRNVGGNPFIIKKHTETNLIVEDGETIVISGLTRQKNIEGERGLPWLKDVPVLGWLFKGESKSQLMEEVLIFITPTIMKPREVSGIQGAP